MATPFEAFRELRLWLHGHRDEGWGRVRPYYSEMLLGLTPEQLDATRVLGGGSEAEMVDEKVLDNLIRLGLVYEGPGDHRDLTELGELVCEAAESR
ncbi:hypothetical protein JYT15_00445 [Acidimicrobium ferrooxidans]|nr:hypothetical protein [Acidimicrobium ferrooxidans]